MDFRLTELNIEIKPLNYLNENQQKTQAKILRISTQLLSTSLGIGIFGIPVAANLSGKWMFILVVFGIAILQYQSNHALLLCQKKLHSECLQTLIKKTFGIKFSTIIIYILMMISLMCSIICYTLIIAQSLMTSFHYMAQNWQIKVPQIMRSQDNCFWILITNLLLTPLLYFKRYSSYSLISLISCFLMCVIVISIVCTVIFDTQETNCFQYQIIKEGQLISLPIIFFAFASHHSIMDFMTESYQNTKKHIVNGLKVHTIVLAILYLIMGLVGACSFNFQTVQFNYGNILGSYNMNPLLCIICNFCLVGFIGLNNLINFKPGKQILTILFRRNNRDSFLWSFTCITIMQLIQIIISCYIFLKGFQIHYLFAIIGLIEPITSNFISFLIFHKIYYYDKSQDLRRYFYYMFMFLVVFCILASLLSILFYALIYSGII